MRDRAVRAAVVLAAIGALFALPTGAAAKGKPSCFGFKATIVGTKHSDHIKGTRHRDVIVARGGNDVIDGNKGPDIVCGGPGNDKIRSRHPDRRSRER